MYEFLSSWWAFFFVGLISIPIVGWWLFQSFAERRYIARKKREARESGHAEWAWRQIPDKKRPRGT